MSFTKVKSWDNRTSGRMLPNGRTWTRRIQWFEDDHESIKLKMEDGDFYKEVLADEASADTVWARFKQGQLIADCISILAGEVPVPLQSRRAAAESATAKVIPKPDA